MPINNTPPASPFPPGWNGPEGTVALGSNFTNYINTLDAASFSGMKKIRTKHRAEPIEPDEPLVPKAGMLFGCDPEGFLFDRKTDKPVPAAGILNGTKWEPFKVDKGAYQVDGLAAEFNIEPAATYDDWENNITTVISQLEAAIPDELMLKWVPVVEFAPEDFDRAPDASKILGCDPDIDAYTGDTNPPPMMENPYVRCAGGHVHFGFTENEDLSDLQHLLNCQDVGKQADWFLGGWSVYHDADIVRRNLYGKMGAIRYKPYGVEYRVLSNFWVPDKALRRAVWDRMVSTVNNIAEHYLPDRCSGSMQSGLRQAINDHYIDPGLDQMAKYPLQTLDPRYIAF